MNVRNIIITIIISTISLAIFAQTDSLPHYLQIAAENNPGVKTDFLKYQAALEKVPQAGAWQDPQFDLGFFLHPMEILSGKQVADVKLMQMFPWFGTRKAARTEAQHSAQMAFEQFRETRDQVLLNVYTQWFKLCRLQQQLANNRKNKKLLEQLETLALRKITAGNSSGMSEVLRIRLEISETENNTENVEAEIQAEKAKFNVLLNRSTGNEVQLPDSLLQIQFLFDIESIKSQIIAQNPMLGRISEEKKMYQAKFEMDKKMSYPMFGIGLQYMLINKKPATADVHSNMENMNGKDMIMPMISISIPIYRGKYKAQQRENTFLQQANKEKYLNTQNLLEAELHRLKSNLDNAARKIILYHKQSELAQTTYHLIINEFTSGKCDLSNVIQVQRQLLDYQLKIAEAVADYNTMTAAVQKLISSIEK